MKEEGTEEGVCRMDLYILGGEGGERLGGRGGAVSFPLKLAQGAGIVI